MEKGIQEKEKQMKEGDIFTLMQQNDKDSYGIILHAGFMREQNYIYGFLLEGEQLEKFVSMFPGIKFYMGFHGCYLQVKYDLEKGKLTSTIMTSNVHEDDSVFDALIGEADSFMASIFALETKIIQLMQESKVHQKIKL